jgi:hypothetical protein
LPTTKEKNSGLRGRDKTLNGIGESMINHSPIIFTDLQPAPRKARARRTDPVESHDAAKRIESSGICERQRQAIYDTLQQHGPQTVKELAMRFFWSKEALGKRVLEVGNIALTGKTRDGSREWAVL